jgi:hypothetical protein
VGVDDLRLGPFLELFALLVLGKHNDGNAQHDALAPPPIGDCGHGPVTRSGHCTLIPA